MTFRRFGKTMSGFPGRSDAWSRNLYPKERAIFLTKISGLVFLLRMSDIRLLRSVRVRVSIGPYKQFWLRRMVSHAKANVQLSVCSRCGKTYTCAAPNASKIVRFFIAPVLGFKR